MRNRKKRERSKEYGVPLSDIAFGDVKIQLQFDDIIETDDGWEPINKRAYGRTRCEQLYRRNSTMSERKGLRMYK